MGWGVTGTLLSGMAVWGGVGWLLDRWLDVLLFTPIGIILGVSVAIYVVVVKYGTVDPPPGSRSSHSTDGRGSRSGTQKGQR
jgi:F0F1-type ATP synthase assembly protein I